MQRSRGQLAPLLRQEVRLELRGRRWQLLLDGPVDSHDLRERVQQIAELGRQVFMFLIIPHAVDDLCVGFYLGLGHDFFDQLEEVVLEGEDEFGEEGVVLLLVFAGGEAAVYRHQTIIFEATSPYHHIVTCPKHEQREARDQSHESSLNVTLNHLCSLLASLPSIFAPSRFPVQTHQQVFQTI